MYVEARVEHLDENVVVLRKGDGTAIQYPRAKADREVGANSLRSGDRVHVWQFPRVREDGEEYLDYAVMTLVVDLTFVVAGWKLDERHLLLARLAPAKGGGTERTLPAGIVAQAIGSQTCSRFTLEPGDRIVLRFETGKGVVVLGLALD